MKRETPPPADYVRARLTDERLSQLWSGVERGEATLKARRRRARKATALALLALMLLGVGALFRDWPFGARVAGVSDAPELDRAPAAARELTLSDGSRLYLEEQTRTEVVAVSPGEVRVRARSGRLVCEVAPNAERRFVVEAGAFEVVVTGTRFSVEVGANGAAAASLAVVVKVERGSVEVRQGPQLLARLAAGQLWASESRAVASATPEPGPQSATPEPAPPASPAATTPSTTTPAATSAAASEAPSRSPSAKVLFAQASEARLKGEAKEAARLFAELTRRHPDDERAGYAAFMLGRLRLDELGDAKGAAEAFSFATARPSEGQFLREDAAARLVEALSKLPDRSACRSARESFARRYPASPHQALVSKLCEEL